MSGRQLSVAPSVPLCRLFLLAGESETDEDKKEKGPPPNGRLLSHVHAMLGELGHRVTTGSGRDERSGGEDPIPSARYK